MAEQAHILVVDDEPEIRDLIERYLNSHGFRVSTAADGPGLRDVTNREHVDLILLDLVMPGEDGLQLAGELRSTSDVAIIMLTSKGEMVDRVVEALGRLSTIEAGPRQPIPSVRR